MATTALPWLFLVPGAFFAQTPPKEDPAPPSTELEYQRQYQERIRKEVLNGVYIPKNLDDAMKELDKRIDAEGRDKFKSIPEEKVCELMHFRLGQWIIHNWGFYGGSRFSHYLRSAGVTYPDDMADLVILSYHRRLNEKPFVIKDLASEFKEKRKKEYQEKIKKGEIIYEEARKRN